MGIITDSFYFSSLRHHSREHVTRNWWTDCKLIFLFVPVETGSVHSDPEQVKSRNTWLERITVIRVGRQTSLRLDTFVQSESVFCLQWDSDGSKRSFPGKRLYRSRRYLLAVMEKWFQLIWIGGKKRIVSFGRLALSQSNLYSAHWKPRATLHIAK